MSALSDFVETGLIGFCLLCNFKLVMEGPNEQWRIHLTQKLSLAFALSSWELISWLWNVLPDGSVFVCLGAWSTEQSYDVIYDGDFGLHGISSDSGRN